MKKYIMFFFVAFMVLSSASLHAEDTSKEEPLVEQVTFGDTGVIPGGEATAPVEMTREMMLERLNHLLEHRLDVRENISGITAVEDSPGGIHFEYNGTKLEKLDSDALFGLLRQVNQYLSDKNLQDMERFQKLQRQLKQIRQLDDMNRTQRMMRQQRQLEQQQRQMRQLRQLEQQQRQMRQQR